MNQMTTTIPIRDRHGNIVDERDFVTYAGLLARAHEEGLKSIHIEVIQIPADDNCFTAIVLAVVETDKGTFTGIGDANPENVNARIRPHILRMAATRAKARALRDATNIGTVAVEELSERLDDHNDSTKQDNVRRLPARGDHQPGRRRTDDKMTDAQRGLIYRLLVAKGISPNDAKHELLRAAQEQDLADVGKRQASALIDELKGGRHGA